MKKKLLTVLMVVFVLLVSPLLVFNHTCLECDEIGRCQWVDYGSHRCNEWVDILEFCWAWGGACQPYY